MPRQKFWQTQKFKELQRIWEERLRASGFIDAESNGKLRQNAFNSYRTQIHTVIENKQRYFELLGHWHHQEEFNNDIEKYIMERRSEGISIKQIGIELKAAGKRISNRVSIGRIIRHYEKKWAIKKR